MQTILIRTYKINNKHFNSSITKYNNRKLNDIRKFLHSYNSNWKVNYYNFGYTRIAKKEYIKNDRKIEIIETLHETLI